MCYHCSLLEPAAPQDVAPVCGAAGAELPMGTRDAGSDALCRALSAGMEPGGAKAKGSGAEMQLKAQQDGSERLLGLQRAWGLSCGHFQMGFCTEQTDKS